MNARRLALAAVALFVSSTLDASSIKVAVKKYGVQGSPLPVAFADKPVTVDVTASIDEKGPALDATRWWHQLEWVLRETDTNAERRIATRSIDIVAATRHPLMMGSLAQHRGIFKIGKLKPGNYLLRVRAGGVEGADGFAIRKGDETPFVRDKYLELHAERTTAFNEFKAIQLERATLLPNRADIWISLATRALENGTQEETAGYYTHAIEVIQNNAAQFAKQNPKQAQEIKQRVSATVAQIRALQAALPYYFANRSHLRVVEEEVDGAMHYVLKDRRSGKIDRVVRPEK